MKRWQLTAILLLMTAFLFVVVIIVVTATVGVVDDLLVNAGTTLVAPFLFALAVLIFVGTPTLSLHSLAITALIRLAAFGARIARLVSTALPF